MNLYAHFKTQSTLLTSKEIGEVLRSIGIDLAIGVSVIWWHTVAWILAEQHIVVGIHVGQVISALQHTLLKLGNEAGCFNVNGAI